MKKAETYDVVVVGGGPAGIGSALGAARNGAKTIIIEKAPFLGGCMAMGLPILTYHNQRGEQILAGVAQELIERAQELGGSFGHLPQDLYSPMRTYSLIDSETMKYLTDQLMVEAGVDVLFHAYAGDAIMDGDQVSGVVVHGKGGTETISAKVVIDCSADADIAVAAGAPYEKGSPQGEYMAVTMMMRMVNIDPDVMPVMFDEWQAFGVRAGETEPAFVHGKTGFGRWGDAAVQAELFGDLDASKHSLFVFSLWNGELNANTTRILNLDASDKWDLSYGEIEGRRQARRVHQFLKQNAEGFEKSVLISTGPFLGTRESRRIMGEYTLTADDIIQGTDFADQIGRGAYPVDVYRTDGSGIEQHFIKDGGSFGIPYRIMVPQRVENLLVAGRSVSATRDGLGGVRLMGPCLAMGQAAGTAAALAIDQSTSPRVIDTEELQDRLHSQGVVLTEADAPETIDTPEGYVGPTGSSEL